METPQAAPQQASYGSRLRGTLSSPQNRSILTWAAIFAGLGLVVGALFLNLSARRGKAEAPTATVQTAPEVSATPSGEEDPAYSELVVANNEQAAERAIETGTSQIATVTGIQSAEVEQPAEPEAPEPEPEVVIPPAKEPFVPPPLPPEPERTDRGTSAPASEAAVRELNSAMVEEIKAIMDASTPVTTTSTSYAPATDDKGKGAQPAPPTGSAPEQKPERKVVLQAGDVLYAVMDSEADSDIPGPIRATVVGGEHNGATLLGSFQRNGKKLVMNFSRLSPADKNKPSYAIQAVAVNPEDTKIGMATEVNERYLLRYGGMILAGLASGVAEATTAPNQTTTVTGTGAVVVTQDQYGDADTARIAVGRAAEHVSARIEQDTNLPVQVIVAAGTPIGVMLLADVVATRAR